MNDLLNEVQGSSLFIGLNLKSGYHQMRLQPEDHKKMAFTTKQTMAKLLLLHYAYCIDYLDDILVFTRGSENTHREVVTAMLGLLQGDG